MASIINPIKNHPRLFALSILLLVAGCVLIGLLMNDDEMDVQQYSFATTEGVHYTITMNQDPDSKSERFNIRLLTLDTSSAPLIFMKSLAAQRSKQLRVFRKLDTLQAYLQDIGVVRFEIDAAGFEVAPRRLLGS